MISRIASGMRVGLLCLAASLFAHTTGSTADGLQPVPHPNLDALTAEIRRSLAPAINQFERRSTQLTGSELGRAHGKLGLHYLAHQQQTAARACFENAIRLDPESFQWPYYLAVHFEETGESDEAIRNYRRSLGLNPDNVAGTVRLGLLLVETGAAEAGENLLRLALDKDPQNAAALAGLGGVSVSRGDHAQAVKYYQAALQIQPQATQVYYRLGLAYRQLGQLDLARQALEKRGERIPSIDDPLLALMRAFARPAAEYLQIGTRALEQGDIAKAASALIMAINIDSENSGAHVKLGRAYAAMDRPTEAGEQFSLAVQLAPDDPEANFYLAAFHEMQGEDALAIASYTAAERHRPGYRAALLGLANALMREQRYAESAQQYAGLAADDAQSVDLRYWLGMAALAAGDCAGAEQALLAAFELAPRAGNLIHALTRLYSTCPDVDAANKKNALAYAEMMYSRDPGLDTAETFAMALAANGMYGDAQELQAQAMFEAAKLQDLAAATQLRHNLQRYEEQAPADMAWPAGHPVLMPPRMNINSIR